MKLLKFFTLSFLVVSLSASFAYANNKVQEDMMSKVNVRQKIGTTLPLDLIFQNEDGRNVRLGDLLGDKPAIIVPVYYECPMLCSLILNGFLKTLNVMKWTVGEEFNVITFSFDPKESYELAKAKKKNYLAEYDRPSAKEGWFFLTGSEESVTALTDSLGYQYQFVEQIDEYAHPSALMVVSPAGVITNYFGGVEFSARDFRLALTEASEGKLGSIREFALLLCFHYDPSKGKYGFVIDKVIKIFGTATALAVFLFIFKNLKAERDKKVAVNK